MPTYDYRCEACGHAFEHFQSMSSGRLKACPRCKRRTLVRLVGAGAGLIFKGSGFYETDYKRPAAPAAATAPVETPPKPGASDGAASGPSPASGGGGAAGAG